MEIVGRWMNLTTSASNTASPAMVSIWGIPTTAPWPRSQAKCKAVWPNLSDLVTLQSGHDKVTKTLTDLQKWCTWEEKVWNPSNSDLGIVTFCIMDCIQNCWYALSDPSAQSKSHPLFGIHACRAKQIYLVRFVTRYPPQIWFSPWFSAMSFSILDKLIIGETDVWCLHLIMGKILDNFPNNRWYLVYHS